jgi:polyhydroxyalkanoate synthesis regulator phasin
MMKLIKRTAFVSLGLAAMSAATIKRIGKKIADEGKLSEDEGKKLIDDLLEQSKKSKAEVKKTINNSVKESLTELDVATNKDVKSINNRLDKIEKNLSKKPAAKKATTKKK